jgi:xylulokinase
VSLLGIDVGTTAVKAVVLDPERGVLGSGRTSYPLVRPRPGWVELDGEVYWQAVCSAVRGAIADSCGAAVSALAISSQGETLVPVDGAGAPTRPAIVWLDSRATAESAALDELFGEAVYARTGQPRLSPTWPACKLLWLREHEPDLFARTEAFLLLEDYLISRLTGERVGSRCLFSSSLLLDITTGRWWENVLEAIGIDERKLPRLADSGEPVDGLTAEAAGELGLAPGVAVVAGGLDQVLAGIAAGVSPGILVESTGSALAVTATVAELTLDPGRRLPCHISAAANAYCLLAWSQTAGLAVDWARATFLPDLGLDELDEAAAAIAPGAEGLLALSHFEGRSCPDFNPDARAALVGLTLRHTSAHIARALLEAVAFDLRVNLELIEENTGTSDELRSVGGGAGSAIWLQIKADVLQRPVVALDEAEFACIGAALLAGVGTGVFANLEADASRFTRPRRLVEPDAVAGSLYEEQYHRYHKLYEGLSPLYRPVYSSVGDVPGV